MKIGARIVKTALSVLVAIYACTWLGYGESSVFAAIAAVLTTQPSIYKTWRNLLNQIQANVLGAILAIIAVVLLGHSPIVIVIVLIITISLNIALKLKDSIILSVVTVIVIMQASEKAYIDFALERFLLIMIGVLAAVLVNILVAPPKYEKEIFEKIKANTEQIGLLIRNLSIRDYEEKYYQKDKKEVEGNITQLYTLFDIYKEEKEKWKNDYQKARKTVIFRHFIKIMDKEKKLISRMRKNSILRHHDSGTGGNCIWGQVFYKQLEELFYYHEKLMLKFEGKVKVVPKEEREELFGQWLMSFQSLTETLEKKKLSKEETEAKEWLHSYMALAQLMELFEELQGLEKMIDSFFNYHSAEAAAKA